MKQYKIIREVTLKYKKGERVQDYRINSPESVYSFLEDKIVDEAQENVVCLYLNNKKDLQSWALISRGTVEEAIVHPREVFKYAIIQNATSVVIAHNHPSGELNPSIADVKMTNMLIEAGELLGIELLDHVIVSVNGYYSMRGHA